MSIDWGALAKVAGAAIKGYTDVKNAERGVGQNQTSSSTGDDIANMLNSYTDQLKDERAEESEIAKLEKELAEYQKIQKGLLERNAITRAGEQGNSQSYSYVPTAENRATGLNGEFNSRLQQMMNDAKAAGHSLSIGGGYRSVQRQKELWEGIGAKRYPNESVRAKYYARPGGSSHGYGFAADMQFNSPGAQNWMVQNLENYGLYNRMPYKGEFHHVEPKGYHPSMKTGYRWN